MRKLTITLGIMLMALTASAQDHLVRRNPKTNQQTTTPTTNTKPMSKSRQGAKSKPSGISFCPDNNHPHAIDLGLPSGTKWACCNVDAKGPEAYGGYYAWGETKTKTKYEWTNYQHCDGTYTSCRDIGSSISGTQYDVAHMKWGGEWQIPTKEQWEELYDNSDYQSMKMNGIKGDKFTSKLNGKSIFMPAGGWRVDDLVNRGSYGAYWLSTNRTGEVTEAYEILFEVFDHKIAWKNFPGIRSTGYNIRPVTK